MSDQTGGRVTAAPALLDRYLARYAGRTRENLCGYLRRWVAWCETRGVGWPTATADDALTWAAELRDAGRSTRTVSTLLSALRGLYRWLWVTGQRPDDASQQIPLPPRERSADRVWLARDDLRRLLAAARAADPVTGCAVHLWGLSGLRLGEALRIDIADLSRHDGHVTVAVRRSKATGRDRIALPDATAGLVARCVAGRAAGPLLLSRAGRRLTPIPARQRLRALCHEAGVPAVTPQGLRVGWITLALEAGIPERQVAISACHASSAMVAHYDARRCLVERAAGLALEEWLACPA